MKRKTTNILFALAVGAMTMAHLASQAQTTNLVWDPNNNGADGAGTWNATSTIWTNPASGGTDIAWRNSTNDIAVFGVGNGAAGVVGVATVVTNGGVTFNASGSGNYIITNGTIYLGGTAIVSNNANAAIGSVIAGAAGLTKAGSSTLTITNAGNSYTGVNTISQGTLTAVLPSAANGTVNDTTLGKTTVAIGGGGTLFIDDTGNGSSAAERDLTVTNLMTGTGTVQVRGANTHDWDTVVFSGDLSGFTGTLAVVTNANLRGKAKFAAPSQAAVMSPNATISVSNGTALYLNQALDFGSTIHLYGSANVENLGQIRLEGGARVTNSVVLHANSSIGGNSGFVTGVISESGGSFGFTKVAGGALTNSGANTYSGKTIINAGTLSVNSINSVSGGSASSGLGAPTSVSNGTIDFGTGTTGATLQYTGAGETSDRVINLAGTTGGATINNQGAGLLKFTSNLTATNGGNKTLTLGGAAGTGELAGNITNGPTGETALTKTGANTWTLSATTNTFTGQLQVSGGTLIWNTAGALAPAAGTFKPLNITAGGALTVNGPLRYTSGGSGNVYAYLNVGNNAAGGVGTITINSGGSLTFTNQTSNPNSIVGQQGTGGTSKLVINGGIFNWDGTGGLIFGNGNGSGLLLITNGGTATILKGTGNTEEGYIELGRNSLTSTGTVYLARGTLATDRAIAVGVTTPIGVGYVYFDGGTLKALANQSDWMQAAVNGNINPPNAVTIADGGANIDANGFSVTINNNLLHGGVAATDGGVTKLGLGTLTLGGAGHTFTGPTVVSNGILAVTGSLPSGSAVTVAGGTLTVSGNVGGTVTVQPGGAVGASSGTFSGLVTLNAGNSAVNLQDGAATITTFANGLTLNNGNVLSFDLGSTSDQISVPGTFTHNGTSTINLAAISGVSAATYTLITDAANDIGTTNGFILGNVPSGYLAVLGTSGTALTVTLTQNAPATAFWKGGLDNKWNSISGGTANWTSDSAGTANTGVPPSTPSAVTFAATGAANFSTVLGADFTINNLTLSTANNVTIGGAANTLTLIAGLLNDTTALNNTISVSNVVLGSSQTWQNNSVNPLTVSSKISGASDLTFGGTGVIVLVNTNNNFASTTVSGGTLQLGDGLTSDGAVAGNVTNNSILTFANPAAQSFSGAISGTGQLIKSGSGMLTLPVDNTYSAGTTISNGTLEIVTADGASTGPVEVKSGAAFVCQPTTTTIYPNTVTGSGLVKLLFGSEGLGYNNTGDWLTHLDNLSSFTGTIQLSTTTSTNVNKWTVDTAAVSGTSSLIIDSGAQLYLTGGNSLTFSAIQVNGAGNYQNRGAIRAASGTLTGTISLLGNTTFGTEGGTIAGTIASGAAGTQILTLGGASDLTGNITVSADIGGGTGAIAINKINTGITTLSGNNTFAGPTTNSAGTLTLANGSALQNSTLNLAAGSVVFDSSVSSNAFVLGGLAGTANLTLANNASGAITLTIGNNNNSSLYSGVLNDNGAGSSLTKVGNGTLTLSGANSYSGATAVKGGTLGISTLWTNAASGIALDDGTTLAITVIGTNQIAPAAYTLGSSAGPVTNSFTGLGSTTIAPVSAGTLTLAGQTTVNINGGSFVAGNIYPLISFTSIGGAGGFTVGSLPRGMTAVIVTNGANTIALNVTAFAPVKDVWTGSVNTNWDIATTANWLTNGVAGVYVDGDATRFDDTATGTNVYVTTVVLPSTVIVSNISKTFTFAGKGISGAGGLTKQGSGLLVLGQVNSYNGNTVVSNGTLQLGAANAIPGGSGKGDVAVNSVLDLNTNSDVINGLSGSGTVDTVAGGTPTLTVGSSGSSSVFNGVIQNTAGSLALTKNGSGTLTLGGNNTYSGATTVSGGTLKLANASALGSIAGGTTVATNSTLDLNGQAIGNEVLTLQSGATLQNSSGSAASWTGNINAAGGATYAITGTGDIVVNTFARTSGTGQFDVTNYNIGTIDLAGAVDNGFLNMHVAAGTVILDKTGAVGQRATSALFVEGGTAKLGGTTGDQIYDGNALTVDSGAFDMNGLNETIGNLNGIGGTISNSVAATVGTLTVGGLNATAGDFFGVIQNGAGVVALTKTGTGTETLEAANTYTGNTVINGGTLYLGNAGSISDSATINVASGATLDVTLRSDQTLTLNSGQTLTGAGNVSGSVASMPGSTINPGGVNAIGTLTVSANATLNGKLLLELNRTNTPLNCDQLTIGGTPTYGGILSVTNIGQTLQAGDTFQLFPSAASGFTVNLATTDSHGQIYTWTNKVAIDGSVQVLSVAPPVNTNPTNITAMVSGSTLTLSWPADHLGWHLQVQTNSLSVGLGTNWFTIPGSDAVISTNITLNPASGAVFYRMVYP